MSLTPIPRSPLGFEPNEIVRCVRGTERLKAGGFYTVKAIRRPYNAYYIDIKEIDVPHAYLENRFEKITGGAV